MCNVQWLPPKNLRSLALNYPHGATATTTTGMVEYAMQICSITDSCRLSPPKMQKGTCATHHLNLTTHNQFLTSLHRWSKGMLLLTTEENCKAFQTLYPSLARPSEMLCMKSTCALIHCNTFACPHNARHRRTSCPFPRDTLIIVMQATTAHSSVILQSVLELLRLFASCSVKPLPSAH